MSARDVEKEYDFKEILYNIFIRDDESNHVKTRQYLDNINEDIVKKEKT